MKSVPPNLPAEAGRWSQEEASLTRPKSSLRREFVENGVTKFPVEGLGTQTNIDGVITEVAVVIVATVGLRVVPANIADIGLCIIHSLAADGLRSRSFVDELIYLGGQDGSDFEVGTTSSAGASTAAVVLRIGNRVGTDICDGLLDGRI